MNHESRSGMETKGSWLVIFPWTCRFYNLTGKRFARKSKRATISIPKFRKLFGKSGWSADLSSKLDLQLFTNKSRSFRVEVRLGFVRICRGKRRNHRFQNRYAPLAWKLFTGRACSRDRGRSACFIKREIYPTRRGVPCPAHFKIREASRLTGNKTDR